MLGCLTLKEPEYGSGSRAIPINSPSDIRYIRITDFSDDGIPPNHEFVTAEKIEDKYTLEHEDVLFARSGATAGKTFIYTTDVGEAIFAGYCIRFQFDCTKVIPKFVYFYTKTQRYQSWVNSIQRPSGQPNINKEEFKSFTIPLPSLDTQRSLVAEIEAARQNRKQKLAQADELLSSLDAYLLGQLGLSAPEESDRKVFAISLKQVGSDKRIDADYFHPERILAIREQKTRTGLRSEHLEEIADFIRDTFPALDSEGYLGLANVQSNTGELVESGDKEAEGQSFVFLENDVLFARLRPYLNKVYRAERGGICSTEFHVIRIKPSYKKNVLPDYLATMLRSSLILAQTRHMMTGNTHPRLTNEDVVNLVVPIPKREIQERLVAETKRRRLEARQLRQEAETEWKAAKTRFERQLLGEEA